MPTQGGRDQIALVEFILLHKPGRRWPAEQDPRFWDSAAEYKDISYNYAKNAILSRDFARGAPWDIIDDVTGTVPTSNFIWR